MSLLVPHNDHVYEGNESAVRCARYLVLGEWPPRWDVWARRGVARDPGVPSLGRRHEGARFVEDCGCGPGELQGCPAQPAGRGPTPQGASGARGGKGPSRTWECIIWHGRLICRVVGDAIVLHPRRLVSLKIGPQIQIQSSFPPSLPSSLPPFLLEGNGHPSRRKPPHVPSAGTRA